MKHAFIYLFLILHPFFGKGQEQPAAYVLAEEQSIWWLSAGDTAYIYADNAYLRDEPNLKGRILDSLQCGTMITILSPAYGGSKVRGFYAPWHEVAYKKDNVVQKGFIWIGLLALGKKMDGQGNAYLYGFDSFIPADDKKPDRYMCSVKLLDEKNTLLGKHQIEMPYTEQSFMEAKLLPHMGLKGLKHIFRIAFSGEACGIPTNYYYAGWNGAQFFDLPSRYVVSDAGVYYYQESMLFPAEHKKEANVIYKVIEEGEAQENTDEFAAINYSIRKKEEKFLWDGKGFTKLADVK
ncbi:hypothetical protein [Sphingobacterium paludis]|uniref:SH3b domain-containing protein n=1 Tax=Sphingobacterium paludis TaxID=1476465 RepID=A0A4R7D0K0_9SPHI|nr:hypothetical protein [Sphingobacterium paludis]TDS12286.1 hypothetical protein B0I21_106144 [Sphingobacterium paludis]